MRKETNSDVRILVLMRARLVFGIRKANGNTSFVDVMCAPCLADDNCFTVSAPIPPPPSCSARVCIITFYTSNALSTNFVVFLPFNGFMKSLFFS